MDTFLAIASRREVRDYDGRPIPDDATRRILDAGRLAGSRSARCRGAEPSSLRIGSEEYWAT